VICDLTWRRRLFVWEQDLLSDLFMLLGTINLTSSKDSCTGSLTILGIFAEVGLL
jgi:hypothetical protein